MMVINPKTKSTIPDTGHRMAARVDKIQVTSLLNRLTAAISGNPFPGGRTL
jgi:hypothetical protein